MPIRKPIHESEIEWDEDVSLPKLPSLKNRAGLLPIHESEIEWAAEETDKSEEHGIAGEFAAGLGRGALRVAATPAYLADVAGEAIGWEGLEKAGEAGAEKVERYIEESPRLKKSESISRNILHSPELWTDPRWYAALVGEGLPTVLSMVIPGMAAAKTARIAGLGIKGVKAARVAGGLGAGIGMEAGGAAEDIRQYEKQTGEHVSVNKKLQTVMGTGIVAGALEYVPIFSIFGKSGAQKLVRRVLAGMATEGATEGAQGLVANAFAKVGYDADQNMVDGVVESIVGGVLLGGGMGAVSKAANFQERIKETNPDEVSDILEKGEKEQQSETLSSIINEGVSTGEVNGQPFTQEQALETIQEAYSDNVFTDEHIKQFKEAYPDLRAGLNEIAPDIAPEVTPESVAQEDPLDTTENEKKFAEDPLHAPNNTEYLSKLIQKMQRPVEDTAFQDKTSEMKRVWSRKIGQLLQGGDKNIDAINEIAGEAESNLNADEYSQWWQAELENIDYVRQSMVGKEGLKGDLGTKERGDILSRKFEEPKEPIKFIGTRKTATGEQPIFENSKGFQIDYDTRKHEISNIDEFEAAQKVKDEKPAEVKLPSLGLEAKKYKTAREFVSKIRGSATQYGDYTPGLRLGGTYPDSKRLSELGVDPEKKITIYRGISDKKAAKEINEGDFVTGDYQSALDYAGYPENVVNKKVRAKDLLVEIADEFTGDISGEEFIYSSKPAAKQAMTDSQLIDIWNKANAKPQPSKAAEVKPSGVTEATIEGEGIGKVAPAKARKPKLSKVRTLRGAIKEMGGINFLNFTGELKDLNQYDQKALFRKTGIGIDQAIDQLIADEWLPKDTTVEFFLEELRINPKDFLSRDRITADILAKKEHELSAQEKKLKESMGYEEEAPPEGEYVTMEAEDLPEGKKLTLMTDQAQWDVYEVQESDPFEVILKDGKTITLSPSEKVQVLKSDLPAQTTKTRQTKAEKEFTPDVNTLPLETIDVTVKSIREKTGETIKEIVPAKEALEGINKEIESYYKLLACVQA